MEKIIISACLMGTACRYDGKSKYYHDIEKLKEYFELIPVCPECDGGLPTPRLPSEITGDRVVNSGGIDVSREYTLGAEKALLCAKENGCRYAVLKAKSPSCGKGFVYDGTFTRTLRQGDGITVKLLKENGIEVFTENEIDELIEEIVKK